jgi:hypothetical protein
MSTLLIVRKNVLLYIIVGMVLLFCTFANDTLGVGPSCSPCDSYEYDWCTGTARCMGCIADCSACYSCDTSIPGEPWCKPKYDMAKCEYCDTGDICSSCVGAKDWCVASGQTCCKAQPPGEGQCYNPTTHECCGGQPHQKGNCMECKNGEWVYKCNPGQGCCNGECYDRATQKCCDDTLWGSEYLCGNNETCCKGQCCPEGQACCNTSFTGGTCYNTTTQKCCPGVSGGFDSIAAMCVAWGSETLCSSEKNTSCPACVGISGSCSGSKAKYYTDEIIWNCSGGCPGPPPDCDYEDPAPNCYDTYFCADYIYYSFAMCTIYPHDPGDIYPPETGPLECYGRDYVWGCTRCQQGSFDKHWPVVSRTCQ